MAVFCIILNKAREKGGRGGQCVAGGSWGEPLISARVLWMLPMSVLAKSTLLYLPMPWWHVQNELVGSPLHCTGCHVPWVSWTVCCADWQLGRELYPTCPPSGRAGTAQLRGQTGQVRVEFMPAAFPSLPWFSVLFWATGLCKTCRGTSLRPSQRPFGQHWPQSSGGRAVVGTVWKS